VSRIVALLTTAALVALAAVALAGPAGTSRLGPDQAEAAECTWRRQAKRVVKHVRRNGRLRKVVRKRHRWTCVPAAAAPAAPAPAPVQPPIAPPPPAPEPEEEVANRVAVKSAEFFYILSRPSVKAGALTVELNNQGQDAHNLNLRLEGDEGAPLEIPETGSLQRKTAKFDLSSGKYRLWCSLPEHEEKGMHTTLIVG
jgi:plastocyanin